MRSGRGIPGDYDPEAELQRLSTEKRVMAAMRYLMEETMRVAGNLALVEGTRTVGKRHTVDAMKHVSMHALGSEDFERRVQAYFAEEVRGDPRSLSACLEDSDDEESDQDSAWETASEEEEEVANLPTGDAALVESVAQSVSAWDEWHPTDALRSSLREAVEQAEYHATN